MLKLTLILSLFFLGHSAEGRLSVSGRDLMYNGRKVFLSGVNIAWSSYGYDFGNNQYASQKSNLEAWLTQIANSGGNSVRIWLHVEGDNTPAYDANGFVTGPDSAGTMINDMRSFLDFAQSKNILVIFVLWNGAYLRNQNTINLFWDDSKLQSYVDKALKPMVSALSNHPALGAWEVMNEPEGSVRKFESNSNACFDTTPISEAGAGWTDVGIPMQNMLKAINWQLAAIKETNSAVLVTVGSWSQHSQSNNCQRCRNHYTNQCLVAAGGKSTGVLDFYQMHTYASGNQWEQGAPFTVQSSSYGLDKPLIIGEFATKCSAGESIQQLFEYGYNSGYQGAWSWHYNAGGECSDDRPTQDAGMNRLKGVDGPGGLVNFPLN